MLKIYNSLTQEKEIFKPIQPPKVSLYVCGVTVYDYCHLGHARTYVAFDVILRYLKAKNYEVDYVRNITDIDDKIIKRAIENKESFETLVTQFTKAMHEDFAALNLLPPTHEPKATAYIPQMVAFIADLIQKNYAYQASNGDVYYKVRQFNDYGKLSHRDIDQLESGARVEINDVKIDPLDFVLWKLAKENEPAWDSPWGKGRPGWHTECSVMSQILLGQQFDLHGGGKDLIFPHHENEIAQSVALTHQPMVNVWMHTGFLQINKEKMSKSLGNFFTIRDVLKEFHPEVIRYFLISSHYRSQLSFSSENLIQAQNALTRLYTALRDLQPAEPAEKTDFELKFYEAMDDDFNTPIALSVLFDLAHEIQKHKESNLLLASQLGALLKKLSHILGLLILEPEIFLQSGKETLDLDKINALIAARTQARADKDWAKADLVRQELTKLNIVVEDTLKGPVWKVKK